MKQILWVAVIAYGLGAFGVGISSAVANSDSMGVTGLIQKALT